MSLSIPEALSGCAFTVAHPDHDGVVALVSGDYVTFGWIGWDDHENEMRVHLDGSGPVQHGCGNDHPGGIHGADAADLYDTVMAMIDHYANDDGEEVN